MHVDANKHTTTLCVPTFKDLNEVIMKETLEDIIELIKCSLKDYAHSKCTVKEACTMNENLDSPFHKSNYVCFLSSETIYK